jgi:hypothetical protein
MIVLAHQPILYPPGLVVSVEDNGPGQDRIDWGPLAALPSYCPVPSGVFGFERSIRSSPLGVSYRCARRRPDASTGMATGPGPKRKRGGGNCHVIPP